MAHAKRDVELAQQVGKSPATIERHRALGVWPADPFADLVRHYEVMGECGLGTGRDNWAVAIDAADRFSWPIKLLCSVLVEPPSHLIDPSFPQRFHITVQTMLVGLAATIPGLVAYREPAAGPTADPAQAVTDDAYRVVFVTMEGNATTAADFEDLGELVQTAAEQASAAGMADDDGEETDRPFAADLRDYWMPRVGRLTPPKPWATSAPWDRLVPAVQVASTLVHLGNQLRPQAASAGDTRRAEVATLAGTFGPIVDEIANLGYGTEDALKMFAALASGTPPITKHAEGTGTEPK